jgi:hypothetical protein
VRLIPKWPARLIPKWAQWQIDNPLPGENPRFNRWFWLNTVSTVWSWFAFIVLVVLSSLILLVLALLGAFE